jgi:ribose 5-phosphate isomerase B
VSESRQPERETVRAMVREALESKLGGGDLGRAQNRPAAAPETAAMVDESVKDVIAEVDVRGVSEGGRLLIRADAIITPSAQDVIRERRIEVTRRVRATATGKHRLIALGADHGGYEMKEQLKRLLDELGYRYRDFGTSSTEAVDYPDFAHAVARAVADGACDLGIVVDGAGIGSCITANKVPGVRAAMCYDEATARNSREHNYANVLTLGGRLLTPEQMRQVVRAWLGTAEGEERHRKRVAKITAIERQYLR